MLGQLTPEALSALMPPEYLSILTGLCALGAFGMSLSTLVFRGGRMSGSDQRRLQALEEGCARLATAESVTALSEKVAGLEGEVKDMNQAMAKVAGIDKEVGVMRAELTAFDRLTTSKLDEINRAVARVEQRSFDPAPAARTRARGVG